MLFIGSISASISPDDINTTLERVGVDSAIDNLFTGDRVDITTEDSRGLAFYPTVQLEHGCN